MGDMAAGARLTSQLITRSESIGTFSAFLAVRPFVTGRAALRRAANPPVRCKTDYARRCVMGSADPPARIASRARPCSGDRTDRTPTELNPYACYL